MNIRRRTIAALAAVSLAATPALALAPTAQAKGTALAEILLADTKKNGSPSFDKNKGDFDILTAAVLAVLDANPHSAVSVLTDPSVKLTAFIPTDGGFKATAKDLGIKAGKEETVTKKLVKALGADGVESVLLYHVVPGAKINAKKASQADGAKLETALGQNIKVKVSKKGITLKDKGGQNPMVVATDINKGKKNKQIAHAIDRVLVPNL